MDAWISNLLPLFRVCVWHSSFLPFSRRPCQLFLSPSSSVWSSTSPLTTLCSPSWTSWRFTSFTFSRMLLECVSPPVYPADNGPWKPQLTTTTKSFCKQVARAWHTHTDTHTHIFCSNWCLAQGHLGIFLNKLGSDPCSNTSNTHSLTNTYSTRDLLKSACWSLRNAFVSRCLLSSLIVFDGERLAAIYTENMFFFFVFVLKFLKNVKWKVYPERTIVINDLPSKYKRHSPICAHTQRRTWLYTWPTPEQFSALLEGILLLIIFNKYCNFSGCLVLSATMLCPPLSHNCSHTFAHTVCLFIHW